MFLKQVYGETWFHVRLQSSWLNSRWRFFLVWSYKAGRHVYLFISSTIPWNYECLVTVSRVSNVLFRKFCSLDRDSCINEGLLFSENFIFFFRYDFSVLTYDEEFNVQTMYRVSLICRFDASCLLLRCSYRRLVSNIKKNIVVSDAWYLPTVDLFSCPITVGLNKMGHHFRPGIPGKMVNSNSFRKLELTEYGLSSHLPIGQEMIDMETDSEIKSFRSLPVGSWKEELKIFQKMTGKRSSPFLSHVPARQFLDWSQDWWPLVRINIA